MEITEIRIKKIEGTNEKMKAVAVITIDDCLVIHDIKIIEGRNGLFVAMPNRKNKDGEYMDIVHPINIETRRFIEESILDAYKNT